VWCRAITQAVVVTVVWDDHCLQGGVATITCDTPKLYRHDYVS